MNIHYFDHATTSRPKAPGVGELTAKFYRELCASPTRSSHRLGKAANRVVARARELACEYFFARSPHHIVFTSGATESLNLVMRSILLPGDEVVASSFDHNSVIRPLARLQETGVIVKTVLANSCLTHFVERFKACLTAQTKLVILTQASNVDGTVLPVSEIAAHARDRGIPVLVDGAQSVGWLKREQLSLGVDYFAASLHKGLLGPFGLGILIVGRDDAQLQPIKDGGTGLETATPLPQSVIPQGLETGTVNAAAIAGAIPALEHALARQMPETVANTLALFRIILQQISTLRQIQAFGPQSQNEIVPIISLQHQLLDPQTFAQRLDQDYGILARSGLHCAPLRHQDLGTSPAGTVRISLGHSTTETDIAALIYALQQLDKEAF